MGYLPNGHLPKSKFSQVHSKIAFNSSEPMLYQLLDWRKKNNKDTIMVVVGEKRSGKSYDCGKIGEDLSAKWEIPFDVEHNVFFEIEDLLDFMNERNGELCIVEESGLLLNSQDWANVQTKIVRDLTMTQGFRRNVIIFNLPHFAFFSKNLRQMTKFLISTKGVGEAVIYRLDIDYAFAEFDSVVKLETINFGMPSEKWVVDYEAKKKVYNDLWLGHDKETMQLLSGKLKIEQPEKEITELEGKNLLKLGIISQEDYLTLLEKENYNSLYKSWKIREAEKLIHPKEKIKIVNGGQFVFPLQ